MPIIVSLYVTTPPLVTRVMRAGGVGHVSCTTAGPVTGRPGVTVQLLGVVSIL